MPDQALGTMLMGTLLSIVAISYRIGSEVGSKRAYKGRSPLLRGHATRGRRM